LKPFPERLEGLIVEKVRVRKGDVSMDQLKPDDEEKK
jgi:hypothetical protein